MSSTGGKRNGTGMESKGAELQKVVERFKGVPVVVVGDLILDHYIWGKVNRISPEAPVVIVEVTEENRRPGGAGNVVNNLISLGAKVSVCGVVGDDQEGRDLVGMLSGLGAEVDGILVDRSRPTSVKTRVIAHGQQVVRVDREDRHELSQAYSEGLGGALQAKFASAAGVIVSDYAKGAISAPLYERIQMGFDKGLLGFGKVPVLVDPKAPNYSLYSRATVIKPNRAEAESASGIAIKSTDDATRAGEELLRRWGCEMVLLTLGEDGMVLVSGIEGQERALEINTVAREVFDVSGAGDTVSATFLLSLAVNATPRQAAELSNLAAGIVVGEVGTVPIELSELNRAIKHLGEEE